MLASLFQWSLQKNYVIVRLGSFFPPTLNLDSGEKAFTVMMAHAAARQDFRATAQILLHNEGKAWIE